MIIPPCEGVVWNGVRLRPTKLLAVLPVLAVRPVVADSGMRWALSSSTLQPLPLELADDDDNVEEKTAAERGMRMAADEPQAETSGYLRNRKEPRSYNRHPIPGPGNMHFQFTSDYGHQLPRVTQLGSVTNRPCQLSRIGTAWSACRTPVNVPRSLDLSSRYLFVSL